MTNRVPSKASLKFLESLSKGRKGKLSISALEGAFDVLGDDWSIKEGPVAYKLSANNERDYAEWLKSQPFSSGLNGFMGFDKLDSGVWGINADSSLNERNLIMMAGKSPKSGPLRPSLGNVYGDKYTGKGESHPWVDRYRFFPLGKTAWIGTDGYVITAPDGDTMDVPMKLQRYSWDWQDFTMNSVWTWLYKKGLKDAAAKFLANAGKEVVDSVVRPSSIRDRSNTGTCSVCSSNVKMRSKQILVDHGFTIPKWSYGRQGSCPGTGWAPIEISVDGAKNYLSKNLKTSKKYYALELKKLKNGPSSIQVRGRGGKSITLGKDDRQFDSALVSQIRNVEGNIKAIDREIDRFTNIVRNWKPGKLYESEKIDPFDDEDDESASERQGFAQDGQGGGYVESNDLVGRVDRLIESVAVVARPLGKPEEWNQPFAGGGYGAFGSAGPMDDEEDMGCECDDDESCNCGMGMGIEGQYGYNRAMKQEAARYEGPALEKGGTSRAGKESPYVRSLLGGLLKDGDVILDYGAGKYGRNANYLRDQGFDVYAYDPYNGKPGADGWEAVSSKTPPLGSSFDVAFSAYVLNVVPEHIEDDIIKDMRRYAKKQVHITRNRDIAEMVKKALGRGEPVVTDFFVTHFAPKYPGAIEELQSGELSSETLNAFIRHGTATSKGFQRVPELEGKGFSLKKKSTGFKAYEK